MKSSAAQFFPLRIYKKQPLLSILNLILCNRIMKSKPIVSNAKQIYNLSTKLFSSTVVGHIINRTFCRALTAGNTLESANKLSEFYRSSQISVIYDYCAEGSINAEDNEATLDENAMLFGKSAQTLAEHNSQMSSIKVTGLVNIKLLKKMNDAVLVRDRFWEEASIDGYMNAKSLFKGVEKMYSGVSDSDITEYLKVIHKYEGPVEQFKMDEVQFKMNHHPYFLYDEQKNKNLIIRLFMPLDTKDEQRLYSMKRRLDEICEPQVNNQTNFKILVDAEQTYLQLAIESVSEQLQENYNKKAVYILPTLQNYLKRSVERAKYEIQIAKRKNLFFGAKLVRGAYIVEETQLSQKNQTENPIVSNYEKTTQNYLQSFRRIVSAFDKGEVVVATHSEDTINQTAAIYKEIDGKIKICYAQLMGLADHLTYKARNDGYLVYKLLPWAKTEVMVDYMIRRAIELNQMRYPLDTQYLLLKHELKCRFRK